MTPATTFPASDGSKMTSKLRGLYQAQKPEIKISLTHKQKLYTTMDRVEGKVTVVASTDTAFDEIEIDFMGTSRTYVERVTTAATMSSRSEAFHQFLKLQQPRLDRLYPAEGILKAGQPYEFPFLFVIPAHLLPKVCQHRVATPEVHEAHLQLPPSFGDKDVLGKGEVIDDMVPDMASIRYGIFARITKKKEQNGEAIKMSVATKVHRVRVMPAALEQPPLDVSQDSEQFVLRKEKTIKKGLLKGKLGTLVMVASQPPSLRLSPRSRSEEQATTMATIMLRFDPTDAASSPPRLSSLSNKLKVYTYYASTARNDYPRKANAGLDLSQGIYSDQVSLSARCVANTEWQKHDPTRPTNFERRDSTLSMSSVVAPNDTPTPSANYESGRPYYTTKLLVPITLPDTKTFVPTFHSCLVSRTYALKMELGLHAGLGSSMTLRVPFQISCGAQGDRDRQASVVSMMSTESEEGPGGDDELPDFFEPRTIRAPSEDLVGRSRIGSQAPVEEAAPPGYSSITNETI
jgi:hypothetical protein